MTKGPTVKSLPESERPRERLQELGPKELTTQELIAVILGRGIGGESVTVTANRLLHCFKTVRGIAEASFEELLAVRGIGKAKAAQIKAVFELAARTEERPGGSGRQVKTPEDVVGEIRDRLRGEKREIFLAMFLDTRGKTIRTAGISEGSLDTSIVHPREVFREAMSACAASVVFVHNHPSGDPSPSAEDVKMTERLVQVGQLVGIDVLDHVIVSDSGFTSMKRKGLL